MIYLNNKKIDSLYLGDSSLGKVYKGSDLVFEKNNSNIQVLSSSNVFNVGMIITNQWRDTYYTFDITPNVLSNIKDDFLLISFLDSIRFSDNNYSKIDFSNLNNNYKQKFNFRFTNASNLEEIIFGDVNEFNVKVGYECFTECHKLKSFIAPKGKFSTHSSNSNKFFYNCTSIETIDLSKLELEPSNSNLFVLDYAFYNCINLKKLILPNLSGAKIYGIRSMFYNCTQLVDVDLSTITDNNNSYANEAFSGCINLESVNLGRYMSRNTGNDYHRNMFYNCNKLKKITCRTEMKNRIKLYSGMSTDLFNSIIWELID